MQLWAAPQLLGEQGRAILFGFDAHRFDDDDIILVLVQNVHNVLPLLVDICSIPEQNEKRKAENEKSDCKTGH